MNCTRPGCTGQIVDGYCDVCGMAPPRAVGPPAAAPGSLPAGGGSQAMPGRSTLTVASLPSARRSGTTATKSSQTGRRLGAGLVEVPPVAVRDPADAVMDNPAVPENRRFCGHCGEPVGRGREGESGRTAGFCRTCGAAFSFEPKLTPGALVADQYEVVGCLAHGGMGWVYLARDRNVSDRWVVLKGLLNAGDRDATAAALAERRFLAEVEHPNIVKIFNFVQHESSGYIVMEYVGGQSLKEILAARREANGGHADPLPPAQAIAYILEILPALGHLHEIGLLFCDFKLDNVIQTRHSLKLIDLGGVYRVDEPASAIFGTVGYQAPEIAAAGPSIASDLFTVARTLAVMCLDFRGYQGTYRFTLPPAESLPLAQRYDSLYRVLLKGTAADPDDRFQSAAEMAEQLHGVLCEIVADVEDRPVPAPSRLFTDPLRAQIDQPQWSVLPRPQADRDDPSAGYLAALTVSDSEQLIAQLRAAPDQTIEVQLRLGAALIEAGDLERAQEILSELLHGDPWEWRATWYQGLAALAGGRAEAATANFTAVYETVPGELAPKLALGLAGEAAGDAAAAARWYRIVFAVDPSVTSAAFGLARCRLRLGDRDGALTAYERVPESSSGYIDAQTARIECLSPGDGAEAATVADVLRAGSILQSLPVDGERREALNARLFAAALELLRTGKISGPSSDSLLGRRLEERDLRLGLERSYRALARRASSRRERVALVDEANQARPRTWI